MTTMKVLPRFAPSACRRIFALGAMGCVFFLGGLHGQTAISSITTTFTAGTPTTITGVNGNSLTEDNDTLAIKTMTDTSGDTFTINQVAVAAYIQTANTQSTTSATDPAAVSAWYLGNSPATTSTPPSTILGTYNSGSPASLLLGNNLLQGSDDLFNNVNTQSGSNNASDVERMDLIMSTTGMALTDSLAVSVMDRGTGDSFEIALITGIGTNGQPDAYGGTLIRVTSTEFGDNLLTTSNSNSTVLDDGGKPTEYLMRYDSSTSLAKGNVTTDTQDLNQNIAGVVLNLGDFGIATGTTIYGYSIMAGDVTDVVGGVTNINDLLNTSNTVYFPSNTNDQGTADNGGLDPVAINGTLFNEFAVPEPSTYGVIFVGLCLAGFALRSAFAKAAADKARLISAF